MSQVINTNALSLVAQNNLNKSQSTLGTAIQRLSSGLRINSAKDDAAGQAISNRFTASISGLTQASRNANDGISIAQTTEGALNEVNDNLQNIRRLTVQAQNGTNSDSDRQSIQDEINARLAEIDRISDQTEFNGVKVLSKDQNLSIQVGANDNETIDIQLNEMNADNLKMTGFNVSGVTVRNLTTLNVGDTFETERTYDIADVDAVFTQPGKPKIIDIVKDSSTGIMYGKCDDNDYYQFLNRGDGYLCVNNTVPISGLDQNNLHSVVGEKYSAKITIDANSVAGLGGKTLSKDNEGNYYTDDGKGNLTSVDLTITNIAYKAEIKFTETAVLATQSTADPLKKIDAALAQVDKLRSGLGAVQNRFDSVISNLNNTVNNLSESRSRILDADFASEVSEMSRANILQSAGTSVLAQANQVPQNVLQLLR